MAKVTPKEKKDRETIVVKTKNRDTGPRPTDWWNANSKSEMCNKFLSTVDFIKTQQQYRFRQAGIYARLYGNLPLFGWAGSSLMRMNSSNMLPMDRPTMSVITSCVDTVVSKLSQQRPKPTYLTDNGDYKARRLAKQINDFIAGEFYQTKLYEQMPLIARDACVLGTGVLKVLRTQENKVGVERRLCTELLVDQNDAFYGSPRMMYELKLIDREVLYEMFPDRPGVVERAEQAYPDASSDYTKTISNQVMVAEGWRLPSGPDAGDGMHVLACSSGVLNPQSLEWNKKRFPFVLFHYSPRMVGLWGQSLAERQCGTQVAINQLLQTIHTSINLVGVPRVFIEMGSKVGKATLNNQVGAIVPYQGTKPQYEVAPCVPVELYGQLQRLIQYAYDQEGISELAAQSEKPKGLNSGVALREFSDIQSDRFAAISRRYDDAHIEGAHLMLDTAIDIAKDTGSYQTVYPNRDGTKEIDLPEVEKLEADPFVIQCFDSSSLPRDPAGRLQKVTEMMQAGIISPQEGRRLLDYPDIDQVDKLASSGEERILQALDQIVEDGKYTPPDPFMDLGLANELVVQYYNLYVPAKLEESRRQLLQNFFDTIQLLKQEAASAAQPPDAQGPVAVPQGRPQSDLLPVAPQGAA